MLIEAKQDGVSFDQTLTLGRQKINLARSEYLKIYNKYYDILQNNRIDDFMSEEYADLFLCKLLNINELSTMDISDYEGAKIIHDLNLPIPVSLEKKYDVVIDGGTLEHIFNFPLAISNCMKMIKEGGSIFIFSMANNHCGHGFYQFSPELFFRIFQPENGFKTKSVILLEHPFPGAELSKKQKCYKVIDPAILGRRGSLVTKSPLGIMVHAEKLKHNKIFESFPIQSDYAKNINNKENKNSFRDDAINKKTHSNLRLFIKNMILRIPLPVKNLFLGYYQLWKCSLKRDKEMYTKS